MSTELFFEVTEELVRNIVNADAGKRLYDFKDFTLVTKESRHDDGAVYTYVVEHRPSGRLYQVEVGYGSYYGYYTEEIDASHFVEVRPEQKLVTVYVPVHEAAEE